MIILIIILPRQPFNSNVFFPKLSLCQGLQKRRKNPETKKKKVRKIILGCKRITLYIRLKVLSPGESEQKRDFGPMHHSPFSIYKPSTYMSILIRNKFAHAINFYVNTSKLSLRSLASFDSLFLCEKVFVQCALCPRLCL